jgi:hypothetical protein
VINRTLLWWHANFAFVIGKIIKLVLVVRAVNEPNLGEPGLSKLTYLKISQAHTELQNLTLARLIKKNSLCEPSSSSSSRRVKPDEPSRADSAKTIYQQ